MDKQAEIKQKITDAFRHTPYPGDDHLIEDSSGRDAESNELLNAFKGKAWKEVSFEMVFDYREALPLFTPAAFRYYLPAYILACVDFYYDIDVAVDSVLFILTPPKERKGWEFDFFLLRVTQFTKEERVAIKSFLELMHQYEVGDRTSMAMDLVESRVEKAFDFWTGLD